MIQLYGITNCDTVRKARKWLDANNIEFQFVDFRKSEFNTSAVESWLTLVSFDEIVNQRSKAWKALSAEQQTQLMQDQALSALVATPTLIKRPLLQTDTQILLGFKEAEYIATLIN